MNIPTTADIRNELKEKYARGEFREGKYGKTVEIQNAHFLADSDSGKYSLGLLKPSVRFKIRDSIVKFFKEYSDEN